MTYQTLGQSLNAFQSRLNSKQAEQARDIFFAGLVNPYYDITWKRIFDVTASILALIVLSPLLLLTALLVKITSRGPVLYMQERVGINRRIRDRRRSYKQTGANQQRTRERRTVLNYGKPFVMYKFRTMKEFAENGNPLWASENDPRITTIGKILRKSRIDEIPQFVNVILGDMSIVGPRPERAFFIGMAEKDVPGFHLRLRTKPGITGLAQVELGYTNNTEGLKKKLIFDIQYIKGLTIWTDLKIVLKTFTVVLTGKGAH